MKLTDDFKILDDNFKASHTPYDLGRESPQLSALSSTELDKYEYLTSKLSGYKPGVVEQTEFEYSPLGKVFHKGLKKGLLKRLKNIEDKNKEQLNGIKDHGERQLDMINKQRTNQQQEMKKQAKQI